MGEEAIPAGLGSKIYFCRAEDFEKDPNTPIQELNLTQHVGDIAILEDEPHEGQGSWNSKDGFSLTATATIKDTPELLKLSHRLIQGQGKLPRRRKKQVMNRVLRHDNRCRVIAAFMVRPIFGRNDALVLTAQVMFHDKVRGYSLLFISEAEYHTAYLCLKRIEKKYMKYIETQK